MPRTVSIAAIKNRGKEIAGETGRREETVLNDLIEAHKKLGIPISFGGQKPPAKGALDFTKPSPDTTPRT